jgi:hypothetical protein
MPTCAQLQPPTQQLTRGCTRCSKQAGVVEQTVAAPQQDSIVNSLASPPRTTSQLGALLTRALCAIWAARQLHTLFTHLSQLA